MRKIDADALKANISEWLNSLYERQNVGSYDEITDTLSKISALEIVIDTIDEAKTVTEDVDSDHIAKWIPANHIAKWIPFDEMPFCMCSNCGSMFDSTICRNKFVLYCPRCGKRIKAVKDDD